MSTAWGSSSTSAWWAGRPSHRNPTGRLWRRSRANARPARLTSKGAFRGTWRRSVSSAWRKSRASGTGALKSWQRTCAGSSEDNRSARTAETLFLLDGGQHAGDAVGAGGVLAGVVDAEEVGEHALQDLAVIGRPEVFLAEAVALLHQVVQAVLLCPALPTIEGIDAARVPAGAVAQDEVGGHAHPLDLQPQPPGYEEVDGAEGDGDPDLPLNNGVEVAVQGIVVVVAVAAESQVLEEEGVDPFDDRVG